MKIPALVGVAAGTTVDEATEIANYQAFKTFAGRLDLVSIFLNQFSTQEFVNSWRWIIDRGTAVAEAMGAKAIRFSIPFPGAASATMTAFNVGEWDDTYRQMIDYALTKNRAREIIFRLPWEFNLEELFQNQSAVADPVTFKRATRRLSSLIAAVSKKRNIACLREWCPNVGLEKVDPEMMWPGDDYCEIVAQDIYLDGRWDKAGIFAWRRDQPRGLAWGAAFAASKYKKYAIAEHGATGAPAPGASGSVIAAEYALFGQWLCGLPHLHNHTVYDRDDGPIASRLSGGSRPDEAAAYLGNFGLA